LDAFRYCLVSTVLADRSFVMRTCGRSTRRERVNEGPRDHLAPHPTPTHPHDAEQEHEINDQNDAGRSLEDPIDTRFPHPRALQIHLEAEGEELLFHSRRLTGHVRLAYLVHGTVVEQHQDAFGDGPRSNEDCGTTFKFQGRRKTIQWDFCKFNSRQRKNRRRRRRGPL
jgi:hypothetical protein